MELEFQAVTLDQANVYFKSMLLYLVLNIEEETIKNVAFKFISDKDLMQAQRSGTVEGSIRALFLQKSRGSECSPRYCRERKRTGWYHTGNMGLSPAGFQINDITFDEANMASMSKVVASTTWKRQLKMKDRLCLSPKQKRQRRKVTRSR